jgi:septum formation protein
MEISATLEPLILASASPRRRDIMTRLGLRFEIKPSDVEEPDLAPPGLPDDDSAAFSAAAIEAGACGSPAGLAETLATLKARRVAEQCSGGTVIGSDTVVAVGAAVLGKPGSEEDARRILSFLSGKTQEVISGLCIIHRPSGIELSGHDVTRIWTRHMTADDIDEYIATGECFGKAGAYAIQETGDRFVERIEGSFDNVVGFPTELFETMMAEMENRVVSLEGGTR